MGEEGLLSTASAFGQTGDVGVEEDRFTKHGDSGTRGDGERVLVGDRELRIIKLDDKLNNKNKVCKHMKRENSPRQWDLDNYVGVFERGRGHRRRSAIRRLCIRQLGPALPQGQGIRLGHNSRSFAVLLGNKDAFVVEAHHADISTVQAVLDR